MVLDHSYLTTSQRPVDLRTWFECHWWFTQQLWWGWLWALSFVKTKQLPCVSECVCVCMYVCMYVCLCIYICVSVYLCIYLSPTPQKQDAAQSQFVKRSLTVLSSVFLLLDWLPYLSKRSLSTMLFMNNWRLNIWIQTFPKGISAMRNVNSLVQDLNPCPFSVTVTIILRAHLIYVYVCVPVFVGKYMPTLSMSSYVYLYIYMCVCVCVCTYVYVCMLCMSMSVYVCACVYGFIRIYLLICTLTTKNLRPFWVISLSSKKGQFCN